MTKITYPNKITGNKVTADEMNEIKTSVNTLYDVISGETITISANTENINIISGKTESISANTINLLLKINEVSGATGNFYNKTEIDNKISTTKDEVKNEILGGASAAYDTLLEIQQELQEDDTAISGILTSINNKLDKTNDKVSLSAIEITGVTENTKWTSILDVFKGFVYWVQNFSFSGLTTNSKSIQGSINEIVSKKTNKLITFNRQTVSYVLQLSDAGEGIEMNVATANNLTIPSNADVAFPIGTQIILVQYGAGQTSIVAGVGVSLRSSGEKLKLASQYSAATAIKIDTNEWYIFGDLAL